MAKNKKYFDEKAHKYYLNDNEVISVTAIVNRFSAEFKADPVAGQLAAKKWKGISDPMLIKKLFDLKRETRASLGTSVHAYLQSLNIAMDYMQPMTVYHEAALRAFIWLKTKFVIEEYEQNLISDYYGIGYTTDGVVRLKANKKRAILDYKTSEMFTVEQFEDVKGRKPPRLKAPFNHLYDVPYEKARIQTCLYKELYNQQYGAERGECEAIAAIHVSPECYKEGYKFYKLEDADIVDDVRRILKGYVISDDAVVKEDDMFAKFAISMV